MAPSLTLSATTGQKNDQGEDEEAQGMQGRREGKEVYKEEWERSSGARMWGRDEKQISWRTERDDQFPQVVGPLSSHISGTDV